MAGRGGPQKGREAMRWKRRAVTREKYQYMLDTYNTMEVAVKILAMLGKEPTRWTRIKMDILTVLINTIAAREGYRIRWSWAYYFKKSGAPAKYYYVYMQEPKMRVIDLDS